MARAGWRQFGDTWELTDFTDVPGLYADVEQQGGEWNYFLESSVYGDDDRFPVFDYGPSRQGDGYATAEQAQGAAEEALSDWRDALPDRFHSGSLHTAPGGGPHPPYKVEQRGEKWVVVNGLGEVKGTHPTKEKARAQQSALYAATSSKQAANPYLPASNPYINDAPEPPGTPDAELDGPPPTTLSNQPAPRQTRVQPDGTAAENTTPQPATRRAMRKRALTEAEKAERRRRIDAVDELQPGDEGWDEYEGEASANGPQVRRAMKIPLVCHTCGTTARVASVWPLPVCPVCKTSENLDLDDDAVDASWPNYSWSPATIGTGTSSASGGGQYTINSAGAWTGNVMASTTTRLALFGDPSLPFEPPTSVGDPSDPMPEGDPEAVKKVPVPEGSPVYTQNALATPVNARRRTSEYTPFVEYTDSRPMQPWGSPSEVRSVGDVAAVQKWFGEDSPEFAAAVAEYQRRYPNVDPETGARSASRRQAVTVVDPVGGGRFHGYTFEEALQIARDSVPAMKKARAPEFWGDLVVLDLFGLGQGYKTYHADAWTRPGEAPMLPWQPPESGVIVARVHPDGSVTQGLSEKVGSRRHRRSAEASRRKQAEQGLPDSDHAVELARSDFAATGGADVQFRILYDGEHSTLYASRDYGRTWGTFDYVQGMPDFQAKGPAQAWLDREAEEIAQDFDLYLADQVWRLQHGGSRKTAGWDDWGPAPWTRVVPGPHGRYEVRTLPNVQRFTDDLDEAKGWVEKAGFGSVIDTANDVRSMSYMGSRKQAVEEDWSGGFARRTAPYDKGPLHWGEYRTPGDVIVRMYRGGGNRVRFYDAQGNQVGPEQSNVAPATAYAMSNGWVNAWMWQQEQRLNGSRHHARLVTVIAPDLQVGDVLVADDGTTATITGFGEARGDLMDVVCDDGATYEFARDHQVQIQQPDAAPAQQAAPVATASRKTAGGWESDDTSVEIHDWDTDTWRTEPGMESWSKVYDTRVAGEPYVGHVWDSTIFGEGWKWSIDANTADAPSGQGTASSLDQAKAAVDAWYGANVKTSSKIAQIVAAILRTNPTMPRHAAEKVARKTVARYPAVVKKAQEWDDFGPIRTRPLPSWWLIEANDGEKHVIAGPLRSQQAAAWAEMRHGETSGFGVSGGIYTVQAVTQEEALAQVPAGPAWTRKGTLVARPSGAGR